MSTARRLHLFCGRNYFAWSGLGILMRRTWQDRPKHSLIVFVVIGVLCGERQDLTKWHQELHTITALILGLRPANEKRRYFVTTSLIGWAQTWNQPCYHTGRKNNSHALSQQQKRSRMWEKYCISGCIMDIDWLIHLVSTGHTHVRIIKLVCLNGKITCSNNIQI